MYHGNHGNIMKKFREMTYDKLLKVHIKYNNELVDLYIQAEGRKPTDKEWMRQSVLTTKLKQIERYMRIRTIKSQK